MAAFALCFDRFDKAAWRIVVMRLARQSLKRHADLRRGDLTPLANLDLLQDVGHRLPFAAFMRWPRIGRTKRGSTHARVWRACQRHGLRQSLRRPGLRPALSLAPFRR